MTFVLDLPYNSPPPNKYPGNQPLEFLKECRLKKSNFKQKNNEMFCWNNVFKVHFYWGENKISHPGIQSLFCTVLEIFSFWFAERSKGALEMMG